jgi:hypothetical protein
VTLSPSPRTRTVLAWLLFAATFGCLAAGLAVALALVRPLTLAVLAEGALAAALYLGFALLGLVISLRRPDNPIGWLLAGSGLVWSLNVPGEAWTVEGFAARLRDQVDLDAPARRAAGGGRPDHAADPGVAVAAARPYGAPVTLAVLRAPSVTFHLVRTRS